ncbi:MAG: hypothetical protein AAGD05_14850, partial [Bacteroidota bacterium]
MKWLLLLLAGLFLQNASAQTSLRSQIDRQIQALQSATPPLMPAEATLYKSTVAQKKMTLFLDLPPSWLRQNFDELTYETWIEYFAPLLYEFAYDDLELQVRNAAGDFVSVVHFLEDYPQAQTQTRLEESNSDAVPDRRGATTRRSARLEGEAQPQGLLSGRTVWLSAGHGWQYDRRRKTFKTQRHNHHGLVEDFVTAEAINYHLLRYLYNAGANVWTVRERDMNPHERIIDNDDGAPFYREVGTWTTSKTSGYQGKTYRYAISKKRSNAEAHFQANLPESGKYWISVRYVSGQNRSVDARYRIHHAGGESIVCVNQEVHGNTWVYLGQFYFEKGRQGKVVLTNESAELGQAIIADAVRFGGGKGNVPDCNFGKSSGEPRFEEAAKYYAAYQGFPYCMNDVMTRPRYAEWELAKGSSAERQNA